MSGIISKVITEYNQMLDEQCRLENKNRELRKALGLANSMISGGESHSKTSRSMIDSALAEE